MPLPSEIKTTEKDLNKIKNFKADSGYIGLAQIDSTVGDFKNNSLKIAKYINYADSINLDMIVFPNLSLTGSPLGTITDRHPFLIEENKKWLNALAKITKKTTAIVGFVDYTTNKDDSVSSVAILNNGKVKQIIRKNDINNDKLPVYKKNGINYGFVFEEDIFNFNIQKNESAIKKLKDAGTDVLIYLTSNFRKNQLQKIYTILKKESAKIEIPIINLNKAGSSDSFVFSGLSCVFNNKGNLIAQAKPFEEDLIIAKPLTENKTITPKYNIDKAFENDSFTLNYENEMEWTYKTLLEGIKGYFRKCGLKRAVLGLSGGLDSSVCAVLLADALGKENVLGVSMPSIITSAESKTDAKILAQNLGINYTEIPIKSVVEVTTNNLSGAFTDVQKIWNDRYKNSYTADNIQARSRASYLWGISNEFPSCIPIATSDKSEAYMGYATINGDMSGGFAPIADITKTKLFALARWLNKNREIKNAIPESVILKKPGAELAIDPKTGEPLKAEDALMPYEFLDEVIWRIENKKESYNDMLNVVFLYEKTNTISNEQKKEWLDKFYKRMSSALYKWSIMPPAVIAENHSINKSVYSQQITSSSINYKGSSQAEIEALLK